MKKKYRPKTLTCKAYGIRMENERKKYYIELWPEAFVFHVRGSLGGLFDLVVIRQVEPEDSFGATQFHPYLSVCLIDVKAGSEKYIRTERKKFEKHCERLLITTGVDFMFDSTVRGSGVWNSESYPGDFEEGT